MVDYFDILNFLIRSVHVVAGVAWIGASFYFVMLDTSLRSPRKQDDIDNGVFGEFWAVHGGGIYSSRKFLEAPKMETLPSNLHWSKWEAYTTWLSGISLLALIYWSRADIYLVDASKNALSGFEASLISIVFIVGFWAIYHCLCKVLRKSSELVFAVVLFLVVALLAWGLNQVFSGKGAFMMFGACLGTAMAANVFFVIIPGQKKMLHAITQGVKPDPELGANGKQRSVHNTYFTLPVLFCMIANHYAAFYSTPYSWLVLLIISLAGVFIRLFFVSRHREGAPSYSMLGIGLALLVCALFIVYKPAAVEPEIAVQAQDQTAVVVVSDQQAKDIIDSRCAGCHASKPTYPGFSSAPKGVIYDTLEQVVAQSKDIYQQAVVLKAMPIGNLTGLTEQERRKLKDWYEGRANKP